MRNFRELEIWKEAMSITNEVYMLTKSFPKEEMYGLSSQLRRAAVSIPSNIAEGCRGSNKVLKHFINIAMGSNFEIETQLMIAQNLGYIGREQTNALIDLLNILQRRTNAFRNTLN